MDIEKIRERDEWKERDEIEREREGDETEREEEREREREEIESIKKVREKKDIQR